jgi:hypothetical protein
MNRRSFLKGMTAAVAAVFVPAVAEASPFDLPRIRELLAPGFVPVSDYVAFVHPSNMAAIRNMMNGEIGRFESVRFIESRTPCP